MTNTEDRLEILHEAKEHIFMAIERIDYATEGTSAEGQARAYTIPHLKDWIDEGNPHTSGTINKLIELIEEEAESKGR